VADVLSTISSINSVIGNNISSNEGNSIYCDTSLLVINNTVIALNNETYCGFVCNISCIESMVNSSMENSSISDQIKSQDTPFIIPVIVAASVTVATGLLIASGYFYGFSKIGTMFKKCFCSGEGTNKQMGAYNDKKREKQLDEMGEKF